MPSEREKMLSGEPYRASDPELVALRRRARRLMRLFNQTTEEESPRRTELLIELLGRVGANIEIEPPFACDYGTNIFLGDGVYMNFGCVILDCHRVEIGDGTMLGPAVQLYAATHDLDPRIRAGGTELAAPVSIGRNVWIGGGAIICSGVRIGDESTIGAGSIVVRDIPSRVFAAGNPCRVIRSV